MATGRDPSRPTRMTRVLASLALLAAAVNAFLIAAQERRLATWQPAAAVVTESGERTYRTTRGGSLGPVPRERGDEPAEEAVKQLDFYRSPRARG